MLTGRTRLIRSYPDTKVIVISDTSNHPFPLRILQAGASSYLSSHISVAELMDAIVTVHTGKKVISPKLAQQLALKSLSEPSDEDPSLLDKLSERELQVMIMVTSGLKVQEISDKLCLSAKTINTYRYQLFDKLKIKNDVELTHLAVQYGLLRKEIVTMCEE